MKKRISIFVAISLVLAFGLSACGLVGDLKSVKDTGDSFMTALKDGDTATSWAALTTAVQEEVGGEDAWVEFAAPRNFESWTFSSTNIENGTGQLVGEGKLGSDTYDIVLILDKVDSVWKISGVQFQIK